MVSDTLDVAPLATHEGVWTLGRLRRIGEAIHAHLQIKLLVPPVGKLSTKREQHEPSPDRLSQIPTVDSGGPAGENRGVRGGEGGGGEGGGDEGGSEGILKVLHVLHRDATERGRLVRSYDSRMLGLRLPGMFAFVQSAGSSTSVILGSSMITLPASSCAAGDDHCSSPQSTAARLAVETTRTSISKLPRRGTTSLLSDTPNEHTRFRRMQSEVVPCWYVY